MMLERNGIFTDLKRGYVLGWKKWGRVFALETLVVILILIAALVKKKAAKGQMDVVVILIALVLHVEV